MNVKGNPAGPINGGFHALKAQILDPRTAIGFATSNNAAAALRIISDIHKELCADVGLNISERLFGAYKDEIDRCTGGEVPDCDFLVLKITGGTKKLWLITKEGIKERERAYIGDATEYKNLMGLRKPYIPPQVETVQQPDGSFVARPLTVGLGEIEFEEIATAMESLVQMRRTKYVGAIAGCILRVVDARHSGTLEYLQLGEVGVSSAEGHTGFSLLASNEDRRGIGIYFRTGKVGFLLIVGDTELCRKETAESIQVFIGVAYEKYGLTLTGAT